MLTVLQVKKIIVPISDVIDYESLGRIFADKELSSEDVGHLMHELENQKEVEDVND